MKVTNNERFAFGILEIAMVLRDTLEYFIPTQEAAGYDPKKYQARKDILEMMLKPNSPFASFCAQNGMGTAKDEQTGKEVPARGQKLLDLVNDFKELVYGNDPRFIRVIDNKLTIDGSYFVPVLENVIGVRETLNDILEVIIKSVKERTPEEIDSSFEELIKVEQRYARAIEFRVTAMQLNTTFVRFNNAVKKYVQTLRDSTSIDPATDPNFKPTDDPEAAFDNNEMGKLFGFMNFLAAHSHEEDEPFKEAITKMQTMAKSFSGEPKITNMDEFMKQFAGVFIPLIKETGMKLQPMFSDAYNSIKAFEDDLRTARGTTPKPPAIETPQTDAEKVASTLASPIEAKAIEDGKGKAE